MNRYAGFQVTRIQEPFNLAICNVALHVVSDMEQTNEITGEVTQKEIL